MMFETTTKITLTEDEVKRIVAKHLSDEGYRVSGEDVKLSVECRWEGYEYGEHQVPFFKECVVVTKLAN